MQWGSSKSLQSLRENTNVTIVGSKVAVPVDLQYHDLANPLPTSPRGAVATVTEFRDVCYETKIVPAGQNVYLQPLLYTFNPPFLVTFYIDATTGDRSHRVKIQWRRRRSSLGSQVVSSEDFLPTSTEAIRSKLITVEDIKASGFGFQVFNESTEDFEVTVDIVVWHTYIPGGIVGW